MTIKELKSILQKVQNLTLQLPNNQKIPAHFHLTEIGRVSKHFIDCGGTERIESYASLQLWYADDFDHRLSTEKLLGIIQKGIKVLHLSEDLEIEVEYQSDTVGKYGLDFLDNKFHLTNKKTACLAEDTCGIPQKPKVKVPLAGCTPGSGCC